MAKLGGMFLLPFVILRATSIVYSLHCLRNQKENKKNLFLLLKIKPATSSHRKKRFEGKRNKMLAEFECAG